MAQGKNEISRKPLYEVFHHARLTFSSRSPEGHARQSRSGKWMPYLPLRGVTQLKSKWDGYRRPKSLRREVSLFVSPSGKHVAISCGNQIVILRKDDNYMQACGFFVSNDRMTTFTRGAWSEYQDILGIIDDANSIHLIKPNGEEIGGSILSQLKLKVPIAAFIVLDDFNLDSRLNGFCVLTIDGCLHPITITSESSVQIPAPIFPSTKKKQFSGDVSCFDYHPSLSLVVLIVSSTGPSNTGKSSGTFYLYVLHIKTSLEVELLYESPPLEGLFSASGYFVNPFSPKVIISPNGKFIATLDFDGRVIIFGVNVALCSVTLLSSNRQEMHLLGQQKSIIDVGWWTDDILAVSTRTGSVMMYDINSFLKVSENENIFSMPIIERAKNSQGSIFILGIAHTSVKCTSEHDEVGGLIDCLGSSWGLMSFSHRSVSEMYSILIRNQNYFDALSFANLYDLNSDEVYKAQWIHSDRGACEVELYLSNVKDLSFVLCECVDTVGRTEEDERALLTFGLRKTDPYIFSVSAKETHESVAWKYRLTRLKLLQYKDRLETFLGVNMGRFVPDDYRKFRDSSLTEVAVSLAESGKIGAVNLLLKRHLYSLSSVILDILSSIPETLPVQQYSQLLPGVRPPPIFDSRESDWVECNETVDFIRKTGSVIIETEPICKLSNDLVWPSSPKLCEWYKKRARTIDNVSGQLDNALLLVDFACQKEVDELKPFFHDILYLHKFIYSEGADEDINMTLMSWEQLSDYGKFSLMLKGIPVDKIVDRLLENAIPFIHGQASFKSLVSDIEIEDNNSFLVKWLKELSAENNLEVCSVVFDGCCKDSLLHGLFKNDAELVKTALECIYTCTTLDQWNIMASILSKLPRKSLGLMSPTVVCLNGSTPRSHRPYDSDITFVQSSAHPTPSSLPEGDLVPQSYEGYTDNTFTVLKDDELDKRLKVAEGHVEVGRLFAFYQVPKPLKFFLEAESDEKIVKQLLRLVLSKFGRRQPSRSDNEWANMWHDMQLFHEKAFPFLDIEYLLVEYIRGLLKAGKFSLATNYLRGTGSTYLAPEKAENLIIQSAREYFFSASSLSCTEIWKAKECLSLLPNNKLVQAEADMIDALTVRLPNLGITLLPMQFKQIRNPMEIINMAITSKTGAYLEVEELIQISKLLGLDSPEDIIAVQEAIAREAAVNGDLQLAFDLSFVLAQKGHGPVWDLCAAIARGPSLDNMDTNSRKMLLSFALSHCDDESIGELLNAWKDLDYLCQYEQLIVTTRSCPPNFSVHGSVTSSLPVYSFEDIIYLRESSENESCSVDPSEKASNFCLRIAKEMLSKICKDIYVTEWDDLLKENIKFVVFSLLELPWLLKLSEKDEHDKKVVTDFDISSTHLLSVRMKALSAVCYWLARNDFAPSDDLITSLSKCAMEPPATKENDMLGCAFLLNLVDTFNGVGVIEEQLNIRQVYEEIHSIMNIGLAYGSLHNSSIACSNPEERRKRLQQIFQVKHDSDVLDSSDLMSQMQTPFWIEWKSKLIEQKQVADQVKELQHVLPGVNAARFLSGDALYIKNVIFSFIDSIKLEKKSILGDAIKLADTYGLDRTEVLFHYLSCVLVSENWGNDDILAEVSGFREDLISCAHGVIDMITTVVYPQIDGRNKQRLSCVYSILSACHLHLSRTKHARLFSLEGQPFKHTLEKYEFYKILEKECQSLSTIDQLNFKNIISFSDLNFEHFNEEICRNIVALTVDLLADTVSTLRGIYADSVLEGILSKEFVYKHFILGILESLKMEFHLSSDTRDVLELKALMTRIEMTYNSCKKYVQLLSDSDISDIVLKFLNLYIPRRLTGKTLDASWKGNLLLILNFWSVLVDNLDFSGSTSKGLQRCLLVFRRLVVSGEISIAQGWNTISEYAEVAFSRNLFGDISYFCKSMVLSGCCFNSILQVYCEAEESSTDSSSVRKQKDLLVLYCDLIDDVLLGLGEDTKYCRNLHYLLSSLSKKSQVSDVECLELIRYEVWVRLSFFSEKMQIESEYRVYALELMQLISGNNLKDLPVGLVSEVEPWEEWEHCYAKQSDLLSVEVSDGVTRNLAALKSTKLAAELILGFAIKPEDLLNLESATLCFWKLSENATSLSDICVLISILELWDGVFSYCEKEKEEDWKHFEVPDECAVDNWGEGWEDIPSEDEKVISPSIHPLHTCWMEIFLRLFGLLSLQKMVDLLDHRLPNSDIALVDEVEANNLIHLVIGVDCFTALKLLLLLPYKALRTPGLIAIEYKLKEENVPRLEAAVDHELMVLIFSSGLLEEIATNPGYLRMFSYLCFSAGYLARLCQEDLLGGGARARNASLFSSFLFPFFVAGLIRIGQYILAGFMVSQWMHLATGFGPVDAIDAGLRRYLESRILGAKSMTSSIFGDADSQRPHVVRISVLHEKLIDQLQAALLLLPEDSNK